MKKIPPLHNDWLEGLPLKPNDAVPALIAAQCLQGKTEDQVRELSETIIKVFDKWKNECGATPPGLTGLLHDKANTEAWFCAGGAVRDPVDLLDHLLTDGYEPVTSLVKQHGEPNLLAVLALRELAMLSVNQRAGFDGLAANLHTETAMKAALQILLRLDETEVNRQVISMVKNVVPKLVDAAAAKAKSEDARKAAEARNAGFRALKLKAIEMFNKKDPPFPSMRKGAKQIAKPLEDYAAENKLPWLTTDEPWVTVYRWIREAGKAGLLKKR